MNVFVQFSQFWNWPIWPSLKKEIIETASYIQTMASQAHILSTKVKSSGLLQNGWNENKLHFMVETRPYKKKMGAISILWIRQNVATKTALKDDFFYENDDRNDDFSTA